jgi:molybdopterin synthase catalytic subunit
MHLDVTVGPETFSLAVEEAALARVSPDAGAVVAFQGRVRGHDGPVPLAALHLEHYPGVTEAEITRIAHLAAARWPLIACRVIHRVGRLAPDEPIVLVLVASSHRQAAFAASEFLMDYLKTEAPFWKREELIDGRQCWVEARTSDADACQRWQAES